MTLKTPLEAQAPILPQGTPLASSEMALCSEFPPFLSCPPPRGPELLRTGMAPGPVLLGGGGLRFCRPPLYPCWDHQPSRQAAGLKADTGHHRGRGSLRSRWRQDLSVGWAGWPRGRTPRSAGSGSWGLWMQPDRSGPSRPPLMPPQVLGLGTVAAPSPHSSGLSHGGPGLSGALLPLPSPAPLPQTICHLGPLRSHILSTTDSHGHQQGLGLHSEGDFATRTW